MFLGAYPFCYAERVCDGVCLSGKKCSGSVPKKLIRFALPLLLASLLQSFYTIVDMLVVGNIARETGLVAISNASMMSFVINSVCIGVTMVGTVLIAQYKGAEEQRGADSNRLEHLAAMLNYFGVSIAAACGVGLKINTFAGMPCWTIGQAVSPILPAVTGLIYFKGKSWESKKIIHHRT